MLLFISFEWKTNCQFHVESFKICQFIKNFINLDEKVLTKLIWFELSIWEHKVHIKLCDKLYELLKKHIQGFKSFSLSTSSLRFKIILHLILFSSLINCKYLHFSLTFISHDSLCRTRMYSNCWLQFGTRDFQAFVEKTWRCSHWRFVELVSGFDPKNTVE